MGSDRKRKAESDPAGAAPPKTKKSRHSADDDETQHVSIRVPIASPMAEGDTLKKTLKLVGKASGNKRIFKGIRDVTKQIRRGEKGVVVLAADVSPLDVISHLPVHCEKNKLPYVWVPGKDDLGAAAQAARATSAILVRAGGDDADLAKNVEKASKEISKLSK